MNRSKDLDSIAPDDIKTKIKNTTKCDNIHDDTIRQILGCTKHSLSSTLIRPHFFNFSERGKDETIYVVLRSHWFVNVSWILIALSMLILPLFIQFIPLQLPISLGFSLTLLLFWYLVSFVFILEKFIAWYFDIFIITNYRVIDVDIRNIIDRSFKEAQIKKIQNLKYKISGVSQTLFNYGTIVVETAGENPDIIFEKIANPAKVLKVLQNLLQNASINK